MQLKVNDLFPFSSFVDFSNLPGNFYKKDREFSQSGASCKPEDWLNLQCQNFDKQENNTDCQTLNLPLKSDGSQYRIEDLYDDQLSVVLIILDKILEWIQCEDLTAFKPLRLTINGPAGTGKTVVINTVVSIIRNLFKENEVVRVCAPTGIAAFNAGGETLHHLLKNKAGMDTYTPCSMSEDKRTFLAKKLRNLLCLIIDERSLLDSTQLGISEQMISETIFNGQMSEFSWGNLPVLVLVGDDYQLPGISDGAFDCLTSKHGNKIKNRGRVILQECASFVATLKTSKRVQEKQADDKKLLSKLRVASDLNNKEIERLLGLHISSIKAKHGPKVVEDIENKSMYLFFRNNKRILKNIEMLVCHSSKENPVAICKTISKGKHNGKAIKSHFGKSDMPSSALLSLGCKVALENRNFCPVWGLHNGANGIVDEIVFDKNKSPNNGDLPLYVVVNFPHYIGPVWDIKNPTVCFPHFFS